MNTPEYNQKPLVEKAVEEILQYIADHNMEVGERIPSENELVALLQTGRGTVREAVRFLIAKGILVIRRGAGTFIVRKYGMESDPLGFAFMQDKYKLAMDLMEVRMMIEPDIAAMAARYATREDIAELEYLCATIEDLINSNQDHASIDIEFHSKIAECSRNSVVANLVPIINSSIKIFVDLTRRQLAEETIETHREICNAIKEHNSIAARDAMMLHLVYNRRDIRSRHSLMASEQSKHSEHSFSEEKRVWFPEYQ